MHGYDAWVTREPEWRTAEPDLITCNTADCLAAEHEMLVDSLKWEVKSTREVADWGCSGLTALLKEHGFVADCGDHQVHEAHENLITETTYEATCPFCGENILRTDN